MLNKINDLPRQLTPTLGGSGLPASSAPRASRQAPRLVADGFERRPAQAPARLELLASARPAAAMRGPPRPYSPSVTNAQVEAGIKQASAERAARLRDIAGSQANSRVVPEDGSIDTTAFHMTLRSGSASADLGFIREAARIGKLEGFQVVVRASNPSEVTRALTAQERANVTVIQVAAQDVWAEDHGEMSVDGTASYSTLVDTRDDQRLIEDAILSDRAKRLPGLPTDFEMHGRVELRRGQKNIAALGLAGNTKLRENFGYLEGGNVLTGSKADGSGYALVGRDSVAVTRAALARDLGRPVSESEALLAISKDLGVEPGSVVPVEQPGDFHIDMYLSVVGDGEVIVNDAREAAALQEKWMREDHARSKPVPSSGAPEGSSAFRSKMDAWTRAGSQLERSLTTLRQDAELAAKYEAKVVSDLEAGGMKVHRMAGVFKDPGTMRPEMNFMNTEKGTGTDGKRFIVALGGEARAQQYVTAKMTELMGDKAPRMHFLDSRLTQPTLDLNGGISCRVKSEGTLIPRPVPQPEPKPESKPLPWFLAA
jgi:hypothetical protein